MNVILAHNHEIIADALALYLADFRPDFKVHKALDFEHVLDYLSESAEIDFAILDIHLPGMNRLEGLMALRTRVPDLPIVILSGTISVQLVREAFSCGADGVFPKQLGGKVLFGALELVLSGGRFVPATVVSEDAAKESFGTGHLGADDPPLDLTQREREVLSLIVKGLSNKAIAQELSFTASTAAFHVNRVFRKLGVRNRATAVAVSFRLGFDVT